MVDFVSVIRRAIDNLSENTPETRFQIYERARSAVSRQLEAMRPNPPKEISDRQLSKLEDSILKIERQYQKVHQTLEKENGVISSEKNARSDNRLFFASRITPISSFAKNTNNSHVETKSDILSDQDNKKVLSNLFLKYPSQRLRNILSSSFASRNQRRLSIFSIFVSKNDKKYSGRFKSEQFFSLSRTVFIAVRKYCLDMLRSVLLFFGTLLEYRFQKYYVVFIVFLGMIGISYSFWNNQEHTVHALVRKFPDQNRQKWDIPTKITRRLLEDGSEVDVGQFDSLAVRKVAFNTSLKSSNTSDNMNAIEGKSIAFISRSGGKPIGSGNVVWSLTGSMQESVIKGDISTINNELSASITLRRNIDVSLSATHLMEIIFYPKESQNDIIDFRQFSMRKAEKGPSVVFDSNVFRTAKNSYLISMKGSPSDPTGNAEILAKYRWIDILVTYRSGKKILLTIDKGKIGTEIFNSAILNWGDRPQQ